MILIDKVIGRDGEIKGVEIDIDGKTYFISRHQGQLRGVKEGKFPPPTDDKGKFLYIGILAFGSDNDQTP